MKDLLYVGNKLSAHGNTATAIEVLGPLLAQDGFRVTFTSSKRNKVLRLADMLWQTIAHSRKADYVLIDTYSTWNFWYAVAVSQFCRLFRLKYIPILHGGNLPHRLTKNPKLCKMVFGHAYINVAPSGYLQNAFTDAGFRVVTIPNPFDRSDFPHRDRQELRPRLLWVRSFAPIYNPEMALTVLALLKDKFPDAGLCMVGPDKGILSMVQQSAELQKLDVVFTGKRTKKEWAALSSDCDIFINTSRVDNMPFSIIEALSLGMAVVSTNVGGIPHLLTHGENAMLVTDGDAKAMADAVVELIENDALRARILQQAQVLAAQSDWENVRDKWREILV